MTEKMIETEKEWILFPHEWLAHLHEIVYKDNGGGIVNIVNANESDSNSGKINMEGGDTS